MIIALTVFGFSLNSQNTLESSLSVNGTCVELSYTSNFSVTSSGVLSGANSIVSILVSDGTGTSTTVCTASIGTWNISSIPASTFAGLGCPIGRDLVQFSIRQTQL